MTASQHRRISPPPLKRLKRAAGSDGSHTATAAATANRRHAYGKPGQKGSIKIVTWNINGITPFVQEYMQKTLHSFFQPAPRASSSTPSRKRQHSPGGKDHGDEHVDDDLSKEGKPSLRNVLHRQSWPEILFLQEVKIKPGDDKVMGAVRLAVNGGDGPATSPAFAADATADSRLSSRDVGSRALLADGGPRYEAHFVLPSDPYNAKGFGGKVYGVAAVIRKDFMRECVKCVREPGWDREGRVQIIETSIPVRAAGEALTDHIRPSEQTSSSDSDKGTAQTKNNPDSLRLAIINIYAVNGTFNPYHSTHTGAVIGTRHDRKLALHTELLREAQRLESRGFHVIIAGDLNIARARIDGYPNLRTTPHQHVLNREDFNRKFFTKGGLQADPPRVTAASYHFGEPVEEDGAEGLAESLGGGSAGLQGLDGIDTFRHIHGDARRYTWHSRTKEFATCCDRVDLILASRSLEQNIVDAGIWDSPRDRGPSDHCPLWVDIGRSLPLDKSGSL
ncbi:Endonuclease/exonuclease/phosphatase [Microdochium bolleyi]|uniref:Endonuclease/exonuclease/phosphatase n=1 Tax=Microdochium bolleyi TaxID=196109 RepID=A0A136JJN0_9PEZI|nr:Endonuclease/exonuclease/phosphatase [Microdochium bolleyi]